MSEENGRDYVLAMARELYGRVVYSHKTHERERQIWGKKTGWMNRINVGLISITTVFAVVSVALQPRWVLVLTALFAAATTAFVLWQSSFDPVGKENQHRTAAKELLRIREELLLLIGRCHLGSEQASALEFRLESIGREICALYKFAPDTSPAAYAQARAALKDGEFTFSDEEIDAFLPTKLRKKSPNE